jgi:hypothetical protein
MNPDTFVEALSALQFEHSFNPYSDRCLVHDLEAAPRFRSQALRVLLDAAVRRDVDSLWLGRDLGYLGGRRTGLALTDDIHLDLHAARWGVKIKRATVGRAVAERTAAVIWDVLARIEVPVFLWNVFPLHPHEAADPFSNRMHNARERRAGEEMLCELIRLLRPRRLIAIGNDAASVAQRLSNDCEVLQVRHPSFGGQTVFLRQVHELYDLHTEKQLLL